MPVVSTDIANQALQMIGGNQPAVTGLAPTFDDSTAGKALQKLYLPCVAFILRSYGWDATRRQIALSASGNVGPFTLGYSREYIYPPFALEIWQMIDPANTDPNDPLPTTWNVGNTQVGGVQTKVIWTDIDGALAILNNNPTENVWDASLRETVVRYLASELAQAISGRPETEQSQLSIAQAASKIGEARNG